MRKWLTPPKFEDEYLSFAARVLHITLLLLIGMVLLFLLFATSPAQLIFIPFVLLVFGSSYYLLHIRRYRLASGIFLSGLWLIITFASFSLNGILNAGFSSYAIVIIFSAILFPEPAVILFTCLSILSGIILVLGQTQGVLPLQTTPLFLPDRFFQLAALFAAAGILLTATSRVIRSSSRRLREQQKTLMQRNQELESEIARREQTEATLRASEEKYRLLFENMGVMSAVYATDGTIVLMNRTAAALFDKTPEALQGGNIRDLLQPEDAEAALQQHARVIETHTAEIGEGRVVFPNGKELHYGRQVIPLPLSPNLSDGRPQVLVITTDLTRQKQAEQRERELQVARERNAFLTEFFSTISHDLKTPITIINTSLYLLERAQTAEQRQQKMEQLNQQVALLNQYIQDMLTISRLEYLPGINKETVDLERIAEEVRQLLRPRAETKQIRLDLHVPSDPTPVYGERDQLHRMLVNLVENAVTYTPPNGQVAVSIDTRKDAVLIEVKDSGMGIASDDLPHIFERFYRAEQAKDAEATGSGLGLAIVKKIVEMHDGSIEVQSQPGAGTRFTVQLPIASKN
jgi:PAS domain S-box-containing protein